MPVNRPALFHLSMSVVRRAVGRSSVAASAYRSASRMTDLRTGLVADYRYKQHVTPLPLILPGGAPEIERETFWNRVEAHCRRKDAVVARGIDAALPRGLSRNQETRLAENFGRWLAESYGVAVDIGLHRKPGNPHLDILLSANVVLWNGSLGKKVRALDGVAQQRNQEECTAERIRARWAALSNQALAEAGRMERVDHRSYARQGVPLRPGFHMGRAVAAMEKRDPGSTDVGARLAACQTPQEEPPNPRRIHEHPGVPDRRPRGRKPRPEPPRLPAAAPLGAPGLSQGAAPLGLPGGPVGAAPRQQRPPRR